MKDEFTKHEDITINVNPEMLVMFAKILHMNAPGLFEFGTNQLKITPKGIKELQHIITELYYKSLSAIGIDDLPEDMQIKFED